MKLTHILGLSAAVVMFAACDSNDIADLSAPADGKALHINRVQQDGFVSEDGTRSTFSDTYATVFETGDQLGLILVDANGKQVANVPFTYTEEGDWNNDRNQLYNGSVTKIVAYAPYNENLPADVCDAAAVKNTAGVATDQSDIEALKAADLLVCEMENTADLNINFAHAFSMMRFSSKSSINVGGTDYEYNILLNNMSVTIGNESYVPCQLNGSYVMIVKDGTNLQPEDFKYSYIRYGEDRATKTVTAAANTAAGTIYSFPCPAAGTGEATIGAGSLYCMAGDNVVLLPAGAASVPAGLECRGIIFHSMDEAEFTAFTADNGLDAALSGINGKHGMIVSLQAGGTLFTGDVQTDFLEGIFADYADCGNTDKALGHKLTAMIASACEGGAATFSGLDGAPARLNNCTAWYVPSFGELKYLVRGEENRDVATMVGQETLNSLFASVGGTACPPARTAAPSALSKQRKT